MANTNFASVVGGSLTGKGFTKLTGGSVPKSWQDQNLTGPQDAGVSVIETGRPTHRASLIGVYRSSASPDVFPRPTGTSGAALSLTGSPFWRCQRVQLQASRPIEPGTGAETAWGAEEWLTGSPVIGGVATGKLGNDDALHKSMLTTGSIIDTLKFNLSSTVYVSGEARVLGYTPQIRGPRGSVPGRLAFVYTGTVVVANTPLAEASYTAVMNLATGSSWSANLALTKVGLDIDYRSGSRTVVACEGFLNGTIAIT